MCGFMALSPATEDLAKKFMCKSGVFDRDEFKESAPKMIAMMTDNRK